MRTQIPPKHIRAPPISINITQIPPDNPQTPLRHPQGISREHKTPTDPKRHKQTAPKTPIYCQVLFEYVCWCLLASVGVCCCLLASCVLWICLGVSWGCLGVVWGYLSDIYGNWRRWNVFWGYLGSHSLQYWAITLFWHSPERSDFLSPDYTETIKYQNVRI